MTFLVGKFREHYIIVASIMGFPCLLLWWNSFTPVNTLFVFFLCLLYVILPIGFVSFLTGVEWVRVRFRSTAQ